MLSTRSTTPQRERILAMNRAPVVRDPLRRKVRKSRIDTGVMLPGHRTPTGTRPLGSMDSVKSKGHRIDRKVAW